MAFKMNWFLSINYFFHLLATVILLGSLTGVVGLALPALSKGALSQNQWLDLQKKLIPWANGALVVLLLSGFYQMTTDPNYGGFLILDGLWAWAMLLKHVAYAGMVGVTFYLQFSIYPAIDRLQLLAAKKPEFAAEDQQQLHSREIQLLRVNVVCAVFVLLFTAVMTAV
ncbi:MAG: hypothetical protein ACI9EW_001633 [Cellvibrionaceae bacterium]|jgi:hypothetical protein